MGAIQQAMLAVPPSKTYATWNPADKSAIVTLSGGNLTAGVSIFTNGGMRATLSKSAGKWFWSNVITSGSEDVRFGGANSSWLLSAWLGDDTNSVGYRALTGQVINNNTVLTTIPACTFGDVLGVGLDLDGNFLSFHKNGMPIGSFAIPAGTYFPACSLPRATSITSNFGATALAFSPPTGFNAGLYI